MDDRDDIIHQVNKMFVTGQVKLMSVETLDLLISTIRLAVKIVPESTINPRYVKFWELIRVLGTMGYDIL